MAQLALVIDDDAFFRRLATDQLASLGYEAVEAATGREGLQVFAARNPDIVLLDLTLPDISGYDVLERLASRDEAGRVIVTTANFSLDSALRALRAGAGDYLPKPLRQEALQTAVARVSRRVQMTEERTQLQRQLRQRVADLKMMRHIAQLVTSARPEEEWVAEVTAAICAYIGAEAGSLLMLSADGQALEFYTAIGPASKRVRLVSLPRQQGGVAWWCLEQRQAVRVDDAQADPRFNPRVDQETGFTTRNILAVPIMVGDKAVGVIELLNKRGGGRFSHSDSERLQELSATMAVAVQNVLVARALSRSREQLEQWSRQLEEKVAERTRELEQANREKQQAYEELLLSHQRLQQAQQTLVEREKMAALGLLGAGVAHEINNPLGFVRSNIDTLQQYVRGLRRLAAVVVHAAKRACRMPPDRLLPVLEEVQRVVAEERLDEVLDDLGPLFEEVSEGLGRIAAIVEQLRVFAEEGDPQGRPEPCDLAREIERAAALVGAARSNGDSASLELQLGPLPLLQLPLLSVRQLLLALLGARTRHSGSGHKQLRAYERDGEVFFEVHDAGSDFDRQEVTRLFDPFYQPGCGQEYSGGLGLSAAYGLARSLGGNLSAERDSQGLVLTLRLPATAQGAGLEEAS